jgi:transposase InsO family protein
MSYVGTTGGISGDLVRDLMAEAVEARFGLVDKVPAPIQWLSDNGPGYVAHETQRFARMMGLEVCTTPFYSPESNGMAESFVKTFKRDYVHMNSLPDAVTVLAQLPTWFEDYNENHPHKGLKMKSPREYQRKQLKLEQCPVNQGQLQLQSKYLVPLQTNLLRDCNLCIHFTGILSVLRHTNNRHILHIIVKFNT